jgi:hypothetical protein
MEHSFFPNPEFAEHIPVSLPDGGCPNLDKASQNRAWRRIKQTGILE